MVIFSTASFLRDRLRALFSRSGTAGLPSIDFGTSALRLLAVSFEDDSELHLRSHLDVRRAVSAPPGAPPQPEDYRDPLGNLVADCGLEGSPVIVGLPLRSAIVRRLEVPAATGGNLRNLVRREAGDVLAFPPGDVHFDFQVVARGDRTLRLILVMVQRDKLRQYLRVVRDVGLQPSIVDVSAFALFNFFRFADHAAAESRDTPAMLVDVGHASTDVLVFAGEEALYARSLSRGGDSITRTLARRTGTSYRRARNLKHSVHFLRAEEESEAGINEAIRLEVNRLAAELHRTVEYLENEIKIGAVGSVILCGGGSQLAGLDEHLETRLEIPCRRFTPTVFSKAEPPEEVPSRLVNYGLQLRNSPGSCTVRLNLLPEDMRRNTRRDTRRRYRRAGAVLLGLLAAQMVVAFLGSYADWRSYLTESERALRALRPAVKRVETLRARKDSIRLRLRRLRELERERVPMLELIGDLARWPEELRGRSWLRGLSYSSDGPHGRLKITGVSRDFRDVSRFYRWMETRPYVLRQVNERQSRSSYRFDERTVSMVQFRVTYAVSFSDFPPGKSEVSVTSIRRTGDPRLERES